MKVAKVIGFYELKNPIYLSVDIRYRLSFIDRLKFLLFGEKCVFRLPKEVIARTNSFMKGEEYGNKYND